MDADAAEPVDIDALWDYNQPDQSEARFRQLLESSRHDIGQYAEVLTQIARAQGLQREFDLAHQTLDLTLSLLSPPPNRLFLRYLLERGRVFNSSGQPETARPYFQRAWDEGLELGEDFYAIDAAHMLGIAAPPEERLEWNMRALRHAEQSNEPRARRWLGALYNNIGWTYHDAGLYDEALAIFERGAQWRAAQGQRREEQIARWCVARALRSLGRLDEALAIQRTLADELAASGEADGYVDEELAECLLLLGRPDAARPHFQRAYVALSQDPWLSESEPERLARLRLFGEEVKR